MKLKISQFAKLNNVTYRTVWNWIRNGSVKIERTKTNRVLIVTEDSIVSEPNVAVYVRVSSSEDKLILEKQKERVISFCNAKGYKVNKIVTEIGSGLNDKRPKLLSLLTDNSIDIIVCEHSDRLTRFGFNYISNLLANNNRKVEVINSVINEKEDLIQDFVSVITSFCARLYGQRRSKRKTEELIRDLNK